VPSSDDDFAAIIQREFNEDVNAGQADTDFHFSLDDDEQSYTQLSPAGRHLSAVSYLAIAGVAVGLILTAVRWLAPTSPIWLGWLAIVAFVVGFAGLIVILSRRPPTDPQGQV
jgi:hypothetical protein